VEREHWLLTQSASQAHFEGQGKGQPRQGNANPCRRYGDEILPDPYAIVMTSTMD